MKNWKKPAVTFLISQAITLFGSSITQFAIIWYVSLTTNMGFWVSILTVSAYLPQFLISIFAGVWADKYSKKRLIIIADSMIAFATIIVAILFPYIGEGNAVLITLVVVSLIRSLGTGIQTPAVSAVIPVLVPEEHLMRYNGVNSTIQSIVQFAAPAIAGAVLTFAPINIAMYIDVATAIVGISILAFIMIPFVEPTNKKSMLSEFKEGFSYASKEKFIGKTLLIFAVFVFLCVPAGFMSSLFVGRYYGSEYWYLSLVEIIGFTGMTIGGLIISSSGGFKNRLATLIVGMTIFGGLAIVMGIVNNFIVYLVMMGVYGVALTMVQTATTTLLQEKSAPEQIGKVFGLFGAIFSSSLPIGMLVFGILADYVSLRILMVISGIVLMIVAIIILLQKKFIKQGILIKKVETTETEMEHIEQTTETETEHIEQTAETNTQNVE